MSPTNTTMSDKRSNDESRKPPYRVTRPDRRATCPSSMSNRLATIRTMPAQKNLPKPNNIPEPTLIATPINVSRFGLMCPRASQRTIASMIRWPARPMLAPNICVLFRLKFAESNNTTKAPRVHCANRLGSGLIWIPLLVCVVPLAARFEIHRGQFLQETELSGSYLAKTVVGNNTRAINLKFALYPAAVFFACKNRLFEPLQNMSLWGDQSHVPLMLVTDSQRWVWHVFSDAGRATNVDIIRGRIASIFKTELKGQPVVSGFDLGKNLHIPRGEAYIRTIGVFSLQLHHAPLFSIDNHLSNDSEGNNQVEQVASEEGHTLRQVGPENSHNQQTNKSPRSRNENAPQTSRRDIILTCVGVLGIVGGLILFYHQFSLYINSDKTTCSQRQSKGNRTIV